ncbi:MAG: NAD-dependent epimerase/dehydratase family protein [Acidimicrobiales bacterium]
MSQQPLSVVLGATGGVGHHLVEALERHGHSVRAVSRSGSQVGSAESVSADIDTAEGIIKATAGATVIYMAAAPAYYDWAQRFEGMIDGVITGAERSGAKLVMVDNFYMYGPDVEDIYEDSPQSPPGHKGKTRKALAEQLMAAHEAGRTQVVIGRLSDYYGPGGKNSAMSVTAILPALNGKTLRWGGHPDRPHTLHYLPDVAKAFVTLGESDRANGEVWILPAAEPLTGTQLISLIESETGNSVKWSRPPAALFTVAGIFNKMMRELKETTYQFDQRYVSHANKYLEAFGAFDVTPHAEALRRTFDWYRSEAKAAKVNA